MRDFPKWCRHWTVIMLLSGLLIPTASFGLSDAGNTNFTPWSGYWWPFNKGGLATGFDYAGTPSPLQKYDTLTSGQSLGSAKKWYLDHNYDPAAPDWFGFCGAWAAAAVTEDINFQPAILDKVLYKVGDKKGLVTACHEHDAMVMENAAVPTVFHAWLLRYIKANGIGFFADLDPTIEIWNYPIYRYTMTSSKSPGKESVSCQIWYADDQVHPDYQGSKLMTKTYTYDLFINASGDITGGEWTGSSVSDHPQVLNLPVSQYSANPFLDCNLVLNLARINDDDLESTQPVALSPGDYQLLLLNQDDYRIESAPGDTIILHFAKNLQATAVVILKIYDRTGQVVADRILTSADQELILPSTSPPYSLSLSADSYTADNLYSLNLDLKKSFEYVNSKIQRGFWGGFAITNTQDSVTEKIIVVGYGQNGRPLATYLGPFTLAPGQKQTLLTNDFDVLPVDRDQLTGVKILAASPLAVVNLFGYSGRSMSCYGSSPVRSRLVIPDISTNRDYSRSIWWGLYNPALADLNARLTHYSTNGTPVDSIDLIMPANRAQQYDTNGSPFARSEDHGWVLVSTENNGLLQGHTEWLENGVNKAEALGTLGINRSFFVPQVVGKGAWNESITLINTADTPNTVTLNLVEQEVLASTIITLNPFAKTTYQLAGLFPGVTDATMNRSALEIESSEDIAGYITLATANDDLYYPLLDQDDVHHELFIPHVASNTTWWTAFALFNPSPSDSTVVLATPTDTTGKRRTDLATVLTIPPRSKLVYSIHDLFGNADQDTSFVTFSSPSGPGVAGIYGIGSLNNPMLSGTVMR